MHLSSITRLEVDVTAKKKKAARMIPDRPAKSAPPRGGASFSVNRQPTPKNPECEEQEPM